MFIVKFLGGVEEGRDYTKEQRKYKVARFECKMTPKQPSIHWA